MDIICSKSELFSSTNDFRHHSPRIFFILLCYGLYIPLLCFLCVNMGGSCFPFFFDELIRFNSAKFASGR